MPSDVTRLLSTWSGGNWAALDQLTPVVYRELHQRARNYLRHERPDHTLQPTALFHEAYLRLIDDRPPSRSENADLMALDEALAKLPAFNKRKCHIVEMRYFGGCTVEETAESLAVAGIMVMRNMRLPSHGCTGPRNAKAPRREST